MKKLNKKVPLIFVMFLVVQFTFLLSESVFAEESHAEASSSGISQPFSSADIVPTVLGDAGPVIISDHVMWDVAGSPYILKSDMTISHDATLTINEGVVVEIAPGRSITVDGKISITGKEGNKVVFTSTNDAAYGASGVKGTEDYWEAIYLTGTGEIDVNYAAFAYGNKIFNVEGIFSAIYVDITNANTWGVKVTSTGIFNGTNVTIDNCPECVIDEGLVSLTSSGLIGMTHSTSNGVNGIRPLAIDEKNLVYGQSYALKYGAKNGYKGNYQALALGGEGAAVFNNNLVNGYPELIKVGDYVITEPGNMRNPTINGIDELIAKCNRVPKCTFDNFEPGCPRIITVVIADSVKVNGRKPIKVTGFAKFFVEDVQYEQGHTIITGKYLGTVSSTVKPSTGVNVSGSGAFYGTFVSIQDCDKGINGEGTVSLVSCDINSCQYGLYFNTVAAPVLISNSFAQNSLYGVYNSTPAAVIDAKFNYWGSPDGPSVLDPATNTWSGDGGKVSSGVDYSEWLTEKPSMN